MTTITETFPTNGTTISTGQDLTWTETAGNPVVVTNRLQGEVDTAHNEARAEHDLDSVDHYAQADLVSFVPPTGTGSVIAIVWARFSPSARTAYGFRRHWVGGSVAYYTLCKIVNGTITNLTAQTTLAYTGPETLRVECEGSVITGKINGVPVATVTDTSIAGNRRTGLFMYHAEWVDTDVQWDNFRAGDLGVARSIAATGSFPATGAIAVPS